MFGWLRRIPLLVVEGLGAPAVATPRPSGTGRAGEGPLGRRRVVRTGRPGRRVAIVPCATSACRDLPNFVTFLPGRCARYGATVIRDDRGADQTKRGDDMGQGTG
jgi:hypothetical protein